MAEYQIIWNATTKAALVQDEGDTPPSGFTIIKVFEHDNTDDGVEQGDSLGYSRSHVLYHHVRDALYSVGQQNMQNVEILDASEGNEVPTPIPDPTFTSNPVLNGNGKVGTNFTFNNGTVINGTLTISRLKRGTSIIAIGAGNINTYTIVEGDITRSFRIEQVAQNSEGIQVIAVSNAIVGVAADTAPTPTPTPLPTVTISTAQSKNEGNSGPNIFTYTVTRSNSVGAINVPWTFAAGNTDPADFTGSAYPTGGAAVIANGQTTGTFTVSVVGDTVVEANQTFTVSITPPTGYAAGNSMSATGTIINDDIAAPTLTTLPNIHIHAGSVQVGIEAMYHVGVYTGSPTLSVVWQRGTSPTGPWTDLSDIDAYYTWVEADEDTYTRVKETATNAGGSAPPVYSNVLGPVDAAPVLTSITPPVLILTEDEDEWEAQIVDNTSGAGDIWHLQVATDEAFTNIIYDGTRIIEPSEFEGSVPGIWDYLPVQTADHWKRMEIFRYNEEYEGGIQSSNFSNKLFMEVNVVYSAIFDAAQKTNGLTLSSGDRVMTTPNYGYNGMFATLGTVPLTQPTGYFEVELVETSGSSIEVMVASALPVNNTDGLVRYMSGGYLFYSGGGNSVPAVSEGSKIGIVAHKASGKIWIRTPAGWYGGAPKFNLDGTIAGDSGAGYTTGLTTLFPCVSGNPTTAVSAKINCGQDAFTYPVPVNAVKGWGVNLPQQEAPPAVVNNWIAGTAIPEQGFGYGNPGIFTEVAFPNAEEGAWGIVAINSSGRRIQGVKFGDVVADRLVQNGTANDSPHLSIWAVKDLSFDTGDLEITATGGLANVQIAVGTKLEAGAVSGAVGTPFGYGVLEPVGPFTVASGGVIIAAFAREGSSAPTWDEGTMDSWTGTGQALTLGHRLDNGTLQVSNWNGQGTASVAVVIG